MRRIALSASLWLAVSSVASQEPSEERQRLVAAGNQAKVSLVEAVQKAQTAHGGTALAAALWVGTRDRPGLAYRVQLLRDGKLFTVQVDALSGAVRATVELADSPEPRPERPATDKPSGVVAQDSAKLDFEDGPLGALPPGWVAAETGAAGRLATWRIEQLPSAPSGKRALRLSKTENSGETYNLVLSEAAFPADLDLAVKVHADAGEEDRGGGLIWRARDANHYYVVRWNPLEKNLRAYKVVGGRRTMLKSVDAAADAAAWHALAVRARGTAFTVAFDGKELLTVEDDTFSAPGKVGVWTKADAASSFDDLEVAGRR